MLSKRRNIVRLLLVVALIAPASLAQVTDQQTWDHHYSNAYNGDPFYDGPWHGFDAPNSNGTFGQVFAWKSHFLIRAYLVMADTYGSTVYLDRAEALIEEILYQRDDRRVARGELNVSAKPYFMAPLYYLQPQNRHIGAKGWRLPVANRIRIEALVDGQICDAIMRYVDLVQTDDRFVAYRDNVPRYIADVGETVAMHDPNFVFDRFANIPGIYYYSNPNGAGLYGGSLPLNHNFVILRTAMLLDKHRNNTVHRPKVEAFLEYFWNQVRLVDDRYVWDYDPRGASTAIEDLGHGAIDITSIVLAYDLGLVDRIHMERLARTFTEGMYRGHGDLSGKVDGSGNESNSHHAGIGWIELARFDSRVLDIAIEVLLDDDPVPTWSRPLLAWAEVMRLQNGGGTDDPIDDTDNCPFVPNPDQSDRDGDSVGDACDPCPDDPSITQASWELASTTSTAWLIEPGGIGVAEDGVVWVAETARNQLGRFNVNGVFLGTVGRSGSAQGQFDRPSDIATDPMGNVYVTELGNRRVQVFDAQGNFRFSFGSRGNAPGQFQRPNGIAVDPTGRVVVADSRRDRIMVFDLNGNFMFEFGESGVEPGQFRQPYGVDVGPNGQLYVTDTAKARLQVYDRNGAFLFELGSFGGQLGELVRSRHIFVDNVGRAYVGDIINNRVQVFEPDGSPSSVIKMPPGPEPFVPQGVAIGPDGTVYVSDVGDGTMKTFTPVIVDSDRDGVADCVDACPFNPDMDGDGFSAEPGCGNLPADCDDTNPNCTADCSDFDRDGVCADIDCDDFESSCAYDCADNDGDGVCADSDCDDADDACSQGCGKQGSIFDGLAGCNKVTSSRGGR